jgi:hypothetical protein
MCERSPLGLPHTQTRMSWRPRVVEILLMNPPKTLRVCGDLKTRPKFVGSDSWGQFFCQLSETEREDQEEGGQAEGGYARGSRASRVCARTSTHPRTGIPAGPVRTLAGLQGRWEGWRRKCLRRQPPRTLAGLDVRRSLCAAHPADSNSSACAVEMLTVGKSQDPAWKDVLDTQGLSAAATILEEYGLSCESDMSLVDEEDLAVL